MHTVAAVIDDGMLTFDFAIPCEVFGLDRSDIVDPWYEFLVVAAGERRVRTQTGFMLEATHGLRALERADTIVVPGWGDPAVPPPRPPLLAPQGRVRPRRLGPARRSPRDDALDVRRSARRALPAGRGGSARP